MKPICWLFLIAPLLTNGQDPKGALPVQAAAKRVSPAAIHAVVVGISDYQSPQIPDLQFADKDAIAFSDWLKSAGGGKVPEENIRLRTNESATNARFASDLDWLIEQSDAGDLAIIYFSGHGDVETKTRGQFGFLLTWDTPPTNYKAGAYSIPYLQDVVSTISLDKKAAVLIITDACHAGKLAGSDFGGTQATAQALVQQFAKEIKIMSCQPNELSLEGSEWGGGRGVFSFHLVEGLTGLADKNSDGQVNLFEIGRYLEDRVPAETAPHPQMPMVLGDRQAVLAQVDPGSLAALLQHKGIAAPMAPTAMRGTDPDWSSADSLLYQAFQSALNQGKLLDPPGACAYDLYRQIIQRENLRPYYGAIRRNLAVALQDEVQQALNALLDDDPYEINRWNNHPEKYAEYPLYLQHTLELLGENHYMAASLKSKKAYFEGYLLLKTATESESDKPTRDSLRARVKSLLFEANALDPDAAYVYGALGQLYYFLAVPNAETDSLVYYCSRAIALTPNWLLPYLTIAYEYRYQTDSANAWILRALGRKPQSYHLLERLAWLRQWQGRYAEADSLCQTMLDLRPDLYNAWGTMGVTHIWQLDYAGAERYFRKAWELEKGYGNQAWQYFGLLLLKTRRVGEGLAFYQKLLDDPNYDLGSRYQILIWLCEHFMDNMQYDRAMDCIRQMRSLHVNPDDVWTDWAEGVIDVLEGRDEAGQARLQKTLDASPGGMDGNLLSRKWLALIALHQGDTIRADSLFRAAIARVDLRQTAENCSDALEKAHAAYGDFLLAQNRMAEALAHYRAAANSLPLGYKGWYGQARWAAKTGDRITALDCLEKALDRWYPSAGPILNEPLFKNIRKTKRFKTLMAKHFQR